MVHGTSEVVSRSPRPLTCRPSWALEFKVQDSHGSQDLARLPCRIIPNDFRSTCHKVESLLVRCRPGNPLLPYTLNLAGLLLTARMTYVSRQRREISQIMDKSWEYMLRQGLNRFTGFRNLMT